MKFQFHSPTKIIFGSGSLEMIGTNCKIFGDRTLIVSGKNSMRKYNHLKIVIDSLKKEKILNLIRNQEPNIINSNIIEFTVVDKKANKLRIFFDKNTQELKGWNTKDAYSNDVNFIISKLKTNEVIEDEFFKIPKEEDL